MSVRQVFYDLLDELEQDDVTDTDAVFARVQAQYGVRHQCYVNMSLAGGKQNALDVVHSFPEDFVNIYKRKLYSNDPVMADYMAHGFCAAIVKPYTHADLMAVISAAMEG